MILAGLVAEPIRFTERDVQSMSAAEVDQLSVWCRFEDREAMPYLEV